MFLDLRWTCLSLSKLYCWGNVSSEESRCLGFGVLMWGRLTGISVSVSMCVLRIMCVHCPAVYLLAHLNVCIHSSFFSSHSSYCPAPHSPSKSLRYFHSTVSGLIFTLISWPNRPAYTSHTSFAMFTTLNAKKMKQNNIKLLWIIVLFLSPNFLSQRSLHYIPETWRCHMARLRFGFPACYTIYINQVQI